MDTRALYGALMVVVALQRLLELRLSRRNLRRLRHRGGIESGSGHYPVMVVMHVAFLVACPLEVWALERPFIAPLAAAMAALVVAAMALRWWAMRALGTLWTVRVVCVPGQQRVRRGPYRWLRHPNYLAVVLEMAALPLLHSAWITALVFSIANGLFLVTRIAVEESALQRYCELMAPADGVVTPREEP